MPGDCNYYKEEVENTTRRTVGLAYPDGGGTTTVSYHWCEHPESPCDYDDTHLLGGLLWLECGGDLKKCPLNYDRS